MKKINIDSLIDFLNIFDLLGICVVIFLAFIFQFVLKELPCPLCLLQRLGLLAIGFGFLLNLHYRPSPLHYGLSCLAALYTASVAGRQVLLHIVPGTGGYGLPFLGLHLYTWVFIFSIAISLSTIVILSIPQQYTVKKSTTINTHAFKGLSHLVFIFFVALLVFNCMNTFAECGVNACPDDPIAYRL